MQSVCNERISIAGRQRTVAGAGMWCGYGWNAIETEAVDIYVRVRETASAAVATTIRLQFERVTIIRRSVTTVWHYSSITTATAAAAATTTTSHVHFYPRDALHRAVFYRPFVSTVFASRAFFYSAP